MRRHRRLPVLALLLAVAACTPAQESADTPADSLPSPAPAADRPVAPDLTGPGLDGRQVRLSDYRGKVVVLNVWAAYCGPCRAEAPELARVHRALAGKGLQVLGVDTDADRAQGRAFQKEHDLPYPSLHDPSSRQLLRLPRKYLTQALPYTLFLDRDGRIAARSLGGLTEADVRSVTRTLLEEKAG
ncbi:TlpA family protein disulfide reductase [Streptomyces sp. NPDC052301]|uniref:TlpA family protein disulfide reductase n=1 Tax=Streptomyces sp. NPDC052301 TaxID=3365687 RepID=UPI0037D50D26